MKSAHRIWSPNRDLAIFFVGFILAWTLCVVAVWKFGILPEPVRPWFRNTFWIGAIAIWLIWRRQPAPLRWLGLWPISAKNIALTSGAFIFILAWNALRVQIMHSSAGLLPSMTVDRLIWGFIGVFVEELMFRGVIQSKLSESMSAFFAIVITTVLFFLIHVPGWVTLSIRVNAATVATVILVGIISGTLRYWSRSLWPGFAVHWANNLGAMF